MSLYSDIALEAVRQRKLERRATKRYWRCNPIDRPLAWEDMADAHDEANYCRCLLCNPDQIGRPTVSH